MSRTLNISAIAAAIVVLMSGAAFAAANCIETVTNAVPEPSVVALMATGIGALLVVKFRKRR